jgi:Rps23 Pro-64 3,4-dihydroxylase Tpa1-like proline 4-hydroxylase
MAENAAVTIDYATANRKRFGRTPIQASGYLAVEEQVIEVQLACYGDGARFDVYRDTVFDPPETPQRRVTMVYYLHRLPKVFSGGALRFSSMDGENHNDVVPECDEVVTFPSWGCTVSSRFGCRAMPSKTGALPSTSGFAGEDVRIRCRRSGRDGQ